MGMRERATMVGGTLRTGPAERGGFLVEAELPIERASSEVADAHERGHRVTIRVVVVDDQEVVRSGFAALLETQADLEVVGTAGDGAEAFDLCRRAADRTWP